jgi:hypothetical protein
MLRLRAVATRRAAANQNIKCSEVPSTKETRWTYNNFRAETSLLTRRVVQLLTIKGDRNNNISNEGFEQADDAPT